MRAKVIKIMEKKYQTIRLGRYMRNGKIIKLPINLIN